MNEGKIYEIISDIERGASDMRWTMQNVRRDGADGDAETARELRTLADFCEDRLNRLRQWLPGEEER